MTTTTIPTQTDPTPADRADNTRYDEYSRGGEEGSHWQHGQVAWFNTEKGFGFLTPDIGPAVFVDFQVIDVPGFKTLVAGQPVVFTAAKTPRGPEATRVMPYTRADAAPGIPPQRLPHHARQHRLRCRYTP